MCYILHCKHLSKEEALNVHAIVTKTHMFLVIHATVFEYILYTLLTHQSTSVCNLQPYDCQYVFKVTYKPCGLGDYVMCYDIVYVTLSHVTIKKILLCYVLHDDIIMRANFPYYWPFECGIH